MPTMQDNLTKNCIAVAIPNTGATTIADVFATILIPIFGTSRAILTDEGTNFSVEFRISLSFNSREVIFYGKSNVLLR